MREPNANLRFELAMQRGMSANDNTTVELRIEDRMSNEPIVVIRLTADQWLNVQTGLSLNVEGVVGKNLDRIGKEMHVRQVPVLREVTASYKDDEAKKMASDWAHAFANDDETVEVRRTNAGWVAIYRSWS